MSSSHRALDFAKSQPYTQPTLYLDLEVVKDRARDFKRAFPGVTPHYAVKCNPHPDVLRTLRDEGCRFEVASPAELDLLLSLGVHANTVFSSNPVRANSHTQYLWSKGVEWFVVDTVGELRRVFAIAPKAKLFVRIESHPDPVSDWPLDSKFGAHPLGEVVAIINEAARIGANLVGVGFHVGSQCRTANAWAKSLKRAYDCIEAMQKRGLSPLLINIGGGFPVEHTVPVPAIAEIGAVTLAEFDRLDSEAGFTLLRVAEPGRFLVSEAGVFTCSVMGIARRNGTCWVHLDAGLYGGITEPIGGIPYRLETDADSRPNSQRVMIPCTVAGPTCDSADVCMRAQRLPSDLHADDRVFLLNAGAYTTAYGTHFNGFPPPQTVVVPS